jgi:hypothetical protein
MPSGRQIHVDGALSNLLAATFETAGDFVANRLFPPVPVDKQSNKYYTLRKEAWLALPNTYRAPKARATRIEFDISSDSYYASNYALAAEIPVEDLANADAALNLRASNTSLISTGLLRDWEQRVATAAVTTVSTVQRLTGASAWDAINSADIIEQMAAAHETIFQNTGLRANSLVLDYRSYMYAKRNIRAFERFKYRATGPALLEDSQLKEMFMVDNIWIARSQKNNNPINATGSYTSIWGPVALLARTEQAVSLMTATYGMSFRWTDPELGVPLAVETAREDGAGSRKVEVLEAGYYQDEKVIGSDLGFYIQTKSGMVW